MNIKKKVDYVIQMIIYPYAFETKVFTDIINGENGIRISTKDDLDHGGSHIITYDELLEFLKILLEVDPNTYEPQYAEELNLDEIDNLKITLIKKLEETAFVEKLKDITSNIKEAIKASKNFELKDELTLFLDRMKRRDQDKKEVKIISKTLNTHNKQVVNELDQAKTERGRIIESQTELKKYLTSLLKRGFWIILIGELLSYALGIIANILANVFQENYLFDFDYRIILSVGILSSVLISIIISYLIYRSGLKEKKAKD